MKSRLFTLFFAFVACFCATKAAKFNGIRCNSKVPPTEIQSSLVVNVNGMKIEYCAGSIYKEMLAIIGKIEYREVNAEQHIFIIFNDENAEIEDLGVLTSIDELYRSPIDEWKHSKKEKIPKGIVVLPKEDANQMIRIFNTDGILLGVQEGNRADLNVFRRGTYIIQCGSTITKVTK